MTLAASFTALLMGELVLAVAPTGSALRAGIVIDCLALFLLGPLFYRFVKSVASPGRFDGPIYLLAAIEAAVLVILEILRPWGAVFFRELNLDAARPGSLFYLLVSLSDSWIVAGIAYIAGTAIHQKKRKRRAFFLFILGTGLLLVAFLLHHTLPANRVFLIFPGATLPATVLFAMALVRFDLLDLPLIPLDMIMAQTDMLIVVFDVDGELISMNRKRYRGFDIQQVLKAEDLFDRLSLCITDDEQRDRFQAEFSPPRGGNGTLAVCTDEGSRYLEYHVAPVCYLHGNVGWIFSLRDITEEELGIKNLAEKDKALQQAYEKLKQYEQTTLLREAEESQERLLRSLDQNLRDDLAAVARDVERLVEDPTSEATLGNCLETARTSLAQIRKAVAMLTHEDRGARS